MDGKKFLEILDKNVNQEQLAKDVLAEYVAPKFAEIEAKVQSGEIDLIPGTDLDKVAILAVIAGLKGALGV